MGDAELNDFIRDIFQDICEIESLLKVAKEALNNDNGSISKEDTINTLEIILSKTLNSKFSLNKYINTAFNKSM